MARYGRQTFFQTEDDYNEAIVAARLNEGIEAIAVTDHFRIQDSWGLIMGRAREGHLCLRRIRGVVQGWCPFFMRVRSR